MDPGNGPARYYAGLMYAQQGRPDLAYPIWRNLLADSAPGAPWLEAIRLQIEEVAYLAGDPVTLEDLPQPRTLRGPTPEQMLQAGEMAPEDRQAMIADMVNGLSARLADQGGAPEEWAQLIAALIVLDRSGEALAIYDNAAQVFGDDTAARALMDAAIAPIQEQAE
ncbi:hypothetical protein [Rhodophyticola sp. CCM32]|uniref:hypothetical protein n=1 Tax=Rhodophyticola sp. CCM32 TaxID=2916397 RepID=UPI001EE50C5C|nr:hypothetical protein [Rhodophyticola sp. CCM32]